jgi:hypothetical protein
MIGSAIIDFSSMAVRDTCEKIAEIAFHILVDPTKHLHYPSTRMLGYSIDKTGKSQEKVLVSTSPSNSHERVL